MKKKIFLFSDVMNEYGGIETYLVSMAEELKSKNYDITVCVAKNAKCRFLDNIRKIGVKVITDHKIPGDKYYIRQKLLVRKMAARVKPGDWVFCVRQPMAAIYPYLIKKIHERSGKIAVSWMFTPEFLPLPAGPIGEKLKKAIAMTDAIISVSEAGIPQYEKIYGVLNPINLVRYHNIDYFNEVILASKKKKDYSMGFIGRIDIEQKNMFNMLKAIELLPEEIKINFEFNVYGGGQLEELREMARGFGLCSIVNIHGKYEKTNLREIFERNDFFIYASKYEGGPCFSLLELMSAGKYVVASKVGGIPDLYLNFYEGGRLVDHDCPQSIRSGIEYACEFVKGREFSQEVIRREYLNKYSMKVAQRQFEEVLGLTIA